MTTILSPKTLRIRPTKIDWPQILRDLAGHGVSQYRIAQILQIECSTVQYWAEKECDPKHSAGQALLQIHALFCGETTTNLRITEAKPIF